MAIEKTKFPGFVKDTNTGVVINNNTIEYQRILDHRKHKRELSKVQNKVEVLQKELDAVRQLKDEFEQLKSAIEQLRRK